MKKNNHYKKEIEFKIGEDNVDALMKLADSPEGEELGIFKFQDSNAKGVTFGRKLGCFEREGEGLPTPNDDCPSRLTVANMPFSYSWSKAIWWRCGREAGLELSSFTRSIMPQEMIQLLASLLQHLFNIRVSSPPFNSSCHLLHYFEMI